MTGNKLPKEMTELQTLFAILNVDRGAAALMAGVSIRAMRRYWSGENSPTVETLGDIRAAVIEIASESGTITRMARRRIKAEIGGHMLDILGEVLGE